MQHKNELIIIHSRSPKETETFAQQVSKKLQPQDIVLLKGDLGAGKSTFARALIQSLCGKDTDVPSPTFTLVQTYETHAFTLWHFDLYRIQHPEEIRELGIEEAYRSGVSLIEWPERLGSYMPKKVIEIEIKYGSDENERIISCKGWVP
jgi:tRNA threonylcarbamoyladenosine biosynthesis protein TsaE